MLAHSQRSLKKDYEAYVTADGFPIKFGATEGSRHSLKLLIWRYPVRNLAQNSLIEVPRFLFQDIREVK